MLNNSLKVFYTVLFLFITLAQKAQAGFLDDAGMNPDCMDVGKCSMGDIALGFIGLIRMLLGGIAAIALLFLVWGGVQWVWSGGNADKVKRGKDIFFNTIAALVLAFGSYMITSLFINDILLGGDEGSKYRVSSEEGGSATECTLKPLGERCNASQQNFICSGPDFGENCIEECAAGNLVMKSMLDAEDVGFKCDNRNSYANPAYRTGWCPGNDDYVCILFHGAGPVVTTGEVMGDLNLADIMTWRDIPWQ